MDAGRGGEWRWCAEWAEAGSAQEEALWEDGRPPTWTPTTGVLPTNGPEMGAPTPLAPSMASSDGGALPAACDPRHAGGTTSPSSSSSRLGGLGGGATSSSSASASGGGGLRGGGLYMMGETYATYVLHRNVDYMN